jgi:hypothetical protein
MDGCLRRLMLLLEEGGRLKELIISVYAVGEGVGDHGT